MANEELSPPKGMRDWFGSEALLRQEVISKLKEIFLRYGFAPLETPSIERMSVLTRKGGREIQKEIYRVVDQRGRKLGLRFDHTVPLARFIAGKKELKLPFKRYAIGEVFRDGPSQPEQGRYRSFIQCDVDIVGVEKVSAEAELLFLLHDAFSALGLRDIEIRVNNRKVLNGLLRSFGIKREVFERVFIAIDKLDKLGKEGVWKELEGISELSEEERDAIRSNILNLNGENEEVLNRLKALIKDDEGKEGLRELKEILSYVSSLGNVIRVAPFLVRGLDYYTGPVMEVFSRGESIKSSIGGGGRYDNMIGDFMGGKNRISAVGFSFGIDRIVTLLNKKEKPSPAEIFVLPLDTFKESLRIAQMLRREGIRVDIELKGRSIKKALSYAESLGIPFVGIIGENELKKGVIAVKDLAKRSQQEMSLEEVMRMLNERKGL